LGKKSKFFILKNIRSPTVMVLQQLHQAADKLEVYAKNLHFNMQMKAN